ncbi:MAG: hypothetical protein JXR14_05175 [Paracoccaceae bacterium]
MAIDIAMVVLALSPFFAKNLKQLALYAGPMLLVLFILQPSVAYVSIIGIQEETKPLFLFLPLIFLLFFCMTASRALVLAKFNSNTTALKTVGLALVSLLVSLGLVRGVLLPLLGPWLYQIY